MSLFRTSEIANLRALAVSAMQDSAYILRTAVLDDGGGSTYPDPAGPTVIGPTLGRFWPLNGAELIMASQLGQHGSYRMVFPVGTDIRVTDQIGYQGKVYNVVWVPPVAFHDPDQLVGLEEAGGVFVAIPPSGSTRITRTGASRVTQNGDTRVTA